MDIEILGTESLGVRGMACRVRTAARSVVIDPGVALGSLRHGLRPHPVEVRAGERVRKRIVDALTTATDVVVSHFHGDHMPLADGNAYQLDVEQVEDSIRNARVWTKKVSGETPHVAQRRGGLLDRFPLEVCADDEGNTLRFSPPMPHGPAHAPMGTVMMTRVQDGGDVFVHASDIQLLSDDPVRRILDWAPTVLFASGPALYRNPTPSVLEEAANRLRRLAAAIPVCIIDHHILRDVEGREWLERLNDEHTSRIVCAADFMNRQRLLHEAHRTELYKRFPVPDGWHEASSETS